MWFYFRGKSGSEIRTTLIFTLEKLIQKFYMGLYLFQFNLGFFMLSKTRTTIVVSNGRYTFYQIHFIKHNLSNTFYQIPFIQYLLSNTIYQISFIKYHLSNTIYQISFIRYHLSNNVFLLLCAPFPTLDTTLFVSAIRNKIII